MVSLEVPRTYTELVVAMKGFFAFAICFTILVQVWYYHYIYSRRYGLQTTYTIVLNAVLLFVVLFYVYPLKFLFTLVVGGLTNGLTVPQEQLDRMFSSAQQVPALMVFTAWVTSRFVFYLRCSITMPIANGPSWS